MSSYPIAAAPDLLVALDPASPRPLYKQLYDGLRDGPSLAAFPLVHAFPLVACLRQVSRLDGHVLTD